VHGHATHRASPSQSGRGVSRAGAALQLAFSRS
jgi:hypothetical protein